MQHILRNLGRMDRLSLMEQKWNRAENNEWNRAETMGKLGFIWMAHSAHYYRTWPLVTTGQSIGKRYLVCPIQESIDTPQFGYEIRY